MSDTEPGTKQRKSKRLLLIAKALGFPLRVRAVPGEGRHVDCGFLAKAVPSGSASIREHVNQHSMNPKSALLICCNSHANASGAVAYAMKPEPNS